MEQHRDALVDQWPNMWVRLGCDSEHLHLGALWLGRSTNLMEAVVSALYDRDPSLPVGLDVVRANLSLDQLHALSRRQDISPQAFAQLLGYLQSLPNFQDSAVHQSPNTEEIHLYLELIASSHVQRIERLHHVWMMHRPSSQPFHALRDEIAIPTQLYYVWQLCHQVVQHHARHATLSLQTLMEHVYVSSEVELEPETILEMLTILSGVSADVFYPAAPRLQSESQEDVLATHALIQRVFLQQEVGDTGSSGRKKM